MKHSDSLKEIASALAAAQAEFGGVQKSGENRFDKYRYANLEDYVRTVRPVLAAHGLFVLCGAGEVVALADRATKQGGSEHAVRVRLVVRVMHTSGEWIEADAWGEGQDRADKAVYKAITGARKYGLASLLGLATTDDPEADEGVGHTPPNHQANGKAQSTPPASFLGTFDEATAARGIDADAKAKLTGAILDGYQVTRMTDLTAAQKDLVLDSIRRGRADKYMATEEVADRETAEG